MLIFVVLIFVIYTLAYKHTAMPDPEGVSGMIQYQTMPCIPASPASWILTNDAILHDAQMLPRTQFMARVVDILQEVVLQWVVHKQHFMLARVTLQSALLELLHYINVTE